MTTLIPRTIHAIWVGGILDEKGRSNLVDWKEINGGYGIKLWVDSALYSEEALSQFGQLKEWAIDNNIMICDIALNPKETGGSVYGRSDIYQNMLSKKYYNDECTGEYRNLAAASDILRTEILFQEGGLYIDAKDVFPSEDGLPDQLTSDYGFYYHSEKGDYVNNDILASVPKGTIISALREKINKNYQALYKNENELKSHRNPEFASPKLYGGADPRKQSTLKTSGPGALDATVTYFTKSERFVPEAGKHIKFDKELALNNHYFSIPEQQASSWFDPAASNKYEKIVPIFRNYIREYFNDLIDMKINQIQETIDKVKSISHASFIGGNASFYQELENTKQLFIEFKSALNALPTTMPEKNLSKSLIDTFHPNQIKRINIAGDHLFDRFKNCNASLETLIEYCQENKIEAKVIADTLIQTGTKAYSTYNLGDLMRDLLDTSDGKPVLDKMNDYGIVKPGVMPTKNKW